MLVFVRYSLDTVVIWLPGSQVYIRLEWHIFVCCLFVVVLFIVYQIEGVYSESREGSVSRHQYKLVECTDPNNNTPLSEAAAGGDPPTIRRVIMIQLFACNQRLLVDLILPSLPGSFR